MKQEVYLHKLSNGLPLVVIATDSAVGWTGVAVDAGSRDEQRHEHGLAHFVEHTLFKGTTRRRAYHINNRMESVGGELNAYTTKETTMLYSVFPGEHLARSLDLIGDLIANSCFPEGELEREREVVLEEVASYLDSPAEAVFDDFEDLIFAGSTLGHNILGDEQCLRQMTSASCRSFLDRYYRPRRMALFVMGNYKPDRVVTLAERYLSVLKSEGGTVPAKRAKAVFDTSAPRHSSRDLGLHQSHTVAGTRIGDMYSDYRYTLALLNNILGGPGMNSLLNVELRERRGLVYSVESSIAAYTDCGAWLVYLGCDHDKVEKALAIIGRTVSRLAESPLSAHRLDACKRQYIGQLLVAGDNAEMAALSAGRSLLYFNHITTHGEVISHIKDISAESIRSLAERLTLDRCSTLTLR